MADNFNKPHIGNIEKYVSFEKYKYPKNIVVPFEIKQWNRLEHGNKILRQLEAVRQKFQLSKEAELPENMVKDDVVYATFTSAWDFLLKFEQLNQTKDNPNYQIVNIQREEDPKRDIFRYKVLVMLKKGGVSHFLKRINQYLTEYQVKNGIETNTPKANPLFANIEDIRVATLRAFWSDEPEFPFPEKEEVIWWEAWFRKTNEMTEKLNQVGSNLKAIGANVGLLTLEFPEHYIKMVKGSPKQLSQSLMLLDNLAELRKPQELSDFITYDGITIREKEEWVKDLTKRTESHFSKKSVLVCLLDSGVTNRHPLINPSLPDNRLYSWNRDWGNYDSEPEGGHGTGMAGLALYGDLTEALSQKDNIKLYHGLESFKIYNPNSANDPETYGAIYEYACSRPIIDNPDNPRVFCLSVTNKYPFFKGRPSSSSASIDKISFGSGNDPQLILVSAGNVVIEKFKEFPNKNFYESVLDPGQAYNAITVGTYTRKDRIDAKRWPGWKPISSNGGMAPSNSTSLMWEKQWPNKPDIVMEGGNLAYNGQEVAKLDRLQLITTHKDFRTKILQTFGDSSAAVALASKMAAELRTEYPDYWPETIRGLMVHSAEWTKAMLKDYDLMNKESDRRSLIRSVGYGVPIPERAMHSANNSLTLIAQQTIQPYRFEGSQVRYNDYHLYRIPWPKEVLRDAVGSGDATIKVTLSYFIEPNPGNRQYASDFYYHSHELDFKLIKRSETIQDFQRRISAASSQTEEHNDETVDTTSEPWSLRERIRSKGSIKKDYYKTSGIELAERNVLAIYPKNGWYRTRRKLGKVESKVRYSLIITIETDRTEADIYTPVFNLVQTPIPINLR